jgi:hypothetical protein
MAEEKPFGWRPLDDGYKQELRGLGWSEESISALEATNVYRPVEYGIQALELAVAIVEALSARFGGGVAADIQAKLLGRAKELATEKDVEPQVEARIIRDLAEYPMWDRLKKLTPET